MAEPIDIPFGMVSGVGPRKHVLDGVQIPVWKGNFRGKGSTHCKIQGPSATSCAKMAEMIEMPFGVCTRVGPRNMLDGVQVGATWRMRLNHPCAAAMRPFCQITLTTCYLSIYNLPKISLWPVRVCLSTAGGPTAWKSVGCTPKQATAVEP